MKILIATGGSGGHVYPALTVARELKERGHEILLAGAFGRMTDLVDGQGFPYRDLPAKGLVTDSFKTVWEASAAMAQSMKRSLKIVRDFRPQAVAGFGGYGAFPVVLTSAMLRIPTLIHEQNVVPGRANRLLISMVTRVAVSFEASLAFFPKKKTVLTGYPCRPSPAYDRAELIKELGLTNAGTTLLVFGGSQGSRRINTALAEVLGLLKKDIDLQVIHIAGDKEAVAELERRYEEAKVPHRIFSYMEEIDKAYTLADIVIARSGAGTVSEIARFRTPALLIPYPYAGGHQKENAAVLEKAGAARVLEEEELTPGSLSEAIQDLADHPVPENSWDGIAQPDAASRLAEEVLGLVRS